MIFISSKRVYFRNLGQDHEIREIKNTTEHSTSTVYSNSTWDNVIKRMTENTVAVEIDYEQVHR